MSNTMEDTHVEVDMDTLLEDLTGDTRTHYISPPANQHIGNYQMSVQEILKTAQELGLEVVAICGYRWVPKRNPENYPMCEECTRIAWEWLAADGA